MPARADAGTGNEDFGRRLTSAGRNATPVTCAKNKKGSAQKVSRFTSRRSWFWVTTTSDVKASAPSELSQALSSKSTSAKLSMSAGDPAQPDAWKDLPKSSAPNPVFQSMAHDSSLRGRGATGDIQRAPRGAKLQVRGYTARKMTPYLVFCDIFWKVLDNNTGLTHTGGG